MQLAARSYLQEMGGLDEARDEHIRAGGWYSVQVLYTALFNKGKQLDFHDRVLAYKQAVLAGGPFVQNWGNVHWVAYLLGAGGNIYLLDSMKPGPEVISEAAFAASLVEHETCCQWMKARSICFSFENGTVRKAQNIGRKDDDHGNEGANLRYRHIAVLILLVSIVYSAQSAEPFKPQHASENHCKKKACLLRKVFFYVAL